MALALTVGLITSLPVPALADPPEVVEEPIFNVWLDLEHGLVGFWNISRADMCDWAAGGFVGPPPVEAPVEATVVETKQGALIASFSETRSLELWNLDADADLIGPCEDTNSQTEPWATGAFTCTARDNDLTVSLTRTNAFGDWGQGTVYDAEGVAYRYSMTRDATIDKSGEFDPRSEHFWLRAIAG
jgi:hypothetical protein